jgi:hypothetical protein
MEPLLTTEIQRKEVNNYFLLKNSDSYLKIS